MELKISTYNVILKIKWSPQIFIDHLQCVKLLSKCDRYHSEQNLWLPFLGSWWSQMELNISSGS